MSQNKNITNYNISTQFFIVRIARLAGFHRSRWCSTYQIFIPVMVQHNPNIIPVMVQHNPNINLRDGAAQPKYHSPGWCNTTKYPIPQYGSSARSSRNQTHLIRTFSRCTCMLIRLHIQRKTVLFCKFTVILIFTFAAEDTPSRATGGASAPPDSPPRRRLLPLVPSSADNRKKISTAGEKAPYGSQGDNME